MNTDTEIILETINENDLQIEAEENQKLIKKLEKTKKFKPEIMLSSFNSTYHLELEFTKEMKIPKNYLTLINPKILKVELESEYDTFNYENIVKSWQTLEMTEKKLILKLDI